MLARANKPYRIGESQEQELPVGHATPSYKEAVDTTEGNFRAGLPAFFQITLIS
jgi:hypothetical protein